MSHIQVSLLGTFTLLAHGDRVLIAAELQRTLIAVLAMAVPHAVPVQTLSRALWESSPPAKVRAAIQTYVARLRRVLPDLIRTEGEGYRLDVDPDAVDALRFLRLCAAAAGQRGSPDERNTLAAALAMWRGRAFSDVRSAWLETQYERTLAERRLELIERRVDLDLGTERGVGLVAELAPLADQHPLRESLWARLIIALERRGRAPEALETFERIRGRLAEELGVSPGLGLQRIHERLLAADADCHGGPRVGTVPYQLLSLTRSGSSAFSPLYSGSSSSSDARTSASLVNTLPTPSTPSSVETTTSVWTTSSSSSSWLHPPCGVAPLSPMARIWRIFICGGPPGVC